MKAIRVLITTSLLLSLGACVTINIYFPAAAAEDAARIIVRDVLGQPPGEPKPEDGKTTEPRSSLPGAVTRLAGLALDLLVPPAHAQQADINISTPAINALRSSMRARTPSLAPYYTSGAIGFSRDGLVAVRALDAIPLRDRTSAQKLVADENQDRNALYREIARANGHPEWESNIRETFAKVWVDEAPKGYWYQDSGGNWRQK